MMSSDGSKNLVVIVLTFNSEDSIRQVVEAAKSLASRILVVDSFSKDATQSIAEELGCEFVQHPFENYSQQRNWAQEYAQVPEGNWILHLDADEVVSPELAASIGRAVREDDPRFEGYLVRKLFYFMGRPIRFGSINPSWHLRLYRAGKGMCEERLYDQHFILIEGNAGRLDGRLLDLQITSLERWTASHNRWSDQEAREVFEGLMGGVSSGDSDQTLAADMGGDARMRKRWLKNNLYYRAPLLLRPFIFFFYSYFLRLGFLDGKVGLIYHVLQSFWFRFLVDAKLVELREAKKG